MLEIRPATPADADALWRIAREPGVIEATNGLPSRPLAWHEERLLAIGLNEHRLVAVLDGEVAGWGRLRPALERADA